MEIKKGDLHAWTVCLIAALFFFFIFIQTTAFNAINQYFRSDFGITATQVSIISACYFIGIVIFLFPAGMLLDRFSVKKIIVLSMLISTVATLVFSLTTSLLVAALCRIAIGAVGAFAFLGCVKMASRWFHPNRLELAHVVMVTMSMIVGMVSQTPLTIMSSTFGWRHSMLIIGILGIGITLLILFFVHDYPADHEQVISQQKQQLKAMGFWQSLAKVIQNPQLSHLLPSMI